MQCLSYNTITNTTKNNNNNNNNNKIKYNILITTLQATLLNYNRHYKYYKSIGVYTESSLHLPVLNVIL